MAVTLWRNFSTAALCGMLASCGGGEDGPPPSRPMIVNLSITTTAQSREVTQGGTLNIDIDGTLQRIDIGPAPVFLNTRDAAGVFVPTTVRGPSGNIFRVSIPLAAAVAPGVYSGTLAMRACLDAACNTVYPGTSVSVAYTLRVNPAH